MSENKTWCIEKPALMVIKTQMSQVDDISGAVNQFDLHSLMFNLQVVYHRFRHR